MSLNCSQVEHGDTLGTSGYTYAEWSGSFYPEKRAGRDAPLLRRALLRGRDQQHLLQLPERGMLEGWAEQVRRLPLRAQGLAAHHAPPAPLGRVEGAVDYLFDVRRRSERGSGRSSSSSRRTSRRTWAACARSSSSAGRASRGLRVPARDLVRRRGVRGAPRAQRRARVRRHRGRAKPGAPSWRPPTGATCACAAATTTPGALRPWVARIRAQPWQEAFVFFKHEDGKPLAWPAIEGFMTLAGTGGAQPPVGPVASPRAPPRGRPACRAGRGRERSSRRPAHAS